MGISLDELDKYPQYSGGPFVGREEKEGIGGSGALGGDKELVAASGVPVFVPSSGLRPVVGLRPGATFAADAVV